MNTTEHDDEPKKVAVPVCRPEFVREEELPEEPDEKEESAWQIPRSWHTY